MTPARQAEVSEREAQVLAALREHGSNAQIAGRLHLSVRTVEGHVSSLLRKYGLTDRRELAAMAGAAGPGVPPPAEVAGVPDTRTTFVGRGVEVELVSTALRQERLVTLLGPGGVGKSRLAAVVASSYPSGGAFVDLVPVRDGFVAQTVAAALGVAESSQRPLEEAIVERLHPGRSLLVLDNCEHLLDAVAAFAERLLSACPQARILTTTRERLRAPGERTIPVGPLSLGGAAEALFRDRATSADPGWSAEPATVSDVCARLDGLPLAIELAAARSVSLGTAGLLTAMGDYLRLLAGNRGPDVRHRSLRAVLAWSHDLLDEAEQTLFRRLAIFVGGFDVAAVVSVTSQAPEAVADLLGRLADKSLVAHQRASGRWRLAATVRAFAQDRLRAGGEYEEVRRRHLDWAAATATALEERLDGQWREEFDAVVDDLRGALVNAPPGPDAGSHRLTRSLGHLAYARRFLAESRCHYQHAAGRAPTPAQAAADLRSAADCARTGGASGTEVVDLLLASAEHARAAGDGNAQAIVLARVVEFARRSPALFPIAIPAERLRELLEEAAACGDRSDPVVAARLASARSWTTSSTSYAADLPSARTAVDAARSTGDPVLISAALDALAWAEWCVGAPEIYRLCNAERLRLVTTMNRNDPYTGPEILDALFTAARSPLRTGDLQAALSVGRMSLSDDLLDSRSYGAAWIHIPPLMLVGDFEEALRYATMMWDGWQRAGRPADGRLVASVAGAALAHGLRGDLSDFRMWRGRVHEIAGVTPDFASKLPSPVFADIRMALHTGAVTGAASLLTRAFGDHRGGYFATYCHALGAELAVVAGLADAADRLRQAASTGERNDWAAACLARATWRLHGDPDALAASVEGWERIGARFERACTLMLLPDRAAEGRAELTALGVPGDLPHVS
ncbi:ATP-binding protein [Nonomuraea sp. ZG12]|uniref:ATP-binding protein n=1 Tax=Nonomuraea sp. ZG12 TaxID=3452207 RepID=UPI003F894724